MSKIVISDGAGRTIWESSLPDPLPCGHPRGLVLRIGVEFPLCVRVLDNGGKVIYQGEIDAFRFKGDDDAIDPETASSP